MGLIQEELKLSKTKVFATEKYNGKDIVKITTDNVAIAEAMIINDSDYIAMYDTKADKSGAYYLSKLKSVYECEKIGKKTNENVKEIIENVVAALDRENSTHLNADGVGRDTISKRIYNEYESGRLFDLLKNPGKEYSLFKIIEKKTEPTDKTKNGRVNTSFASKFCHYAAFFIFEGKKEQDNYSIWDSVLRRTIPIYLEKYKLETEKYNLKDYVSYQKAIDDIRNAADEKVSRNGFDHLLWYFHKGRI